ncbi:MAG: carcinine hydrolase/isopenicillin-N N-acyltransferase family protein, partial [Treponema sp.]|uniref:carcinine hydrolase/isopenicillin-N N-acyltransferase family protein n=1 Tax=Treponema sp. TaxID=166 RepID=UPI00298DC3E5
MKRIVLLLYVVCLSFTACAQTKLETGFSYGEFSGDYKFDEFLELGGASSDREVIQFLLHNVVAKVDTQILDDKIFYGAGCSTIQTGNRENGFVFGRNFDWDKCNALVLKTNPAKGYKSISTVNIDFIKAGAGSFSALLSDGLVNKIAAYAPLDGMNEKGLCVSVNMIQDSERTNQNTSKPDITTTTAIRLLMDKAATTDEAVELLKKYDFHPSFGFCVHFAICDTYGKAVAVEYIDNEISIIETPILTNFYVTSGKKYGIGTNQSHQRFEKLEKVVSSHSTSSGTASTNVGTTSSTVSDVAKIMESVSKHNYNEFESTEWSVIFDQKNLT